MDYESDMFPFLKYLTIKPRSKLWSLTFVRFHFKVNSQTTLSASLSLDKVLKMSSVCVVIIEKFGFSWYKHIYRFALDK